MKLEVIRNNGENHKAEIFDAKICRNHIDYQFQEKDGFRFILPFSETKEIILNGKTIYKEENNGWFSVRSQSNTANSYTN